MKFWQHLKTMFKKTHEMLFECEKKVDLFSTEPIQSLGA